MVVRVTSLGERHADEGTINWNDECIKNEARMLSCLNHPNIANLVGWFIMRNAFYSILNYYEGGNLIDCIPPNGRDEFSALHLMIQVFDAIKYTHEHGIAHGNIKPENILLSVDHKRLILTDFGQAHFEDVDLCARDGIGIRIHGGTIGFNGPERDPRENIPFKGFKRADMYGLGVTVYVVLTRHLPYDTSLSIRDQALFFPEKISLPAAQHFIQNLLSIDPSRRMTIAGVFDHSWLRIHDVTGPRARSVTPVHNTTSLKPCRHISNGANHKGKSIAESSKSTAAAKRNRGSVRKNKSFASLFNVASPLIKEKNNNPSLPQ
ncbi:7929_t:CDS:2 [Acaulospora colombiana]|uniref:7929_t:CDS:1 n=1 Tax=Acaulospora colombiana TaxID=27376 RepID=A0ACA9KJ09_9GLOM|nr:7929_t:CDS:2 [Acaulospora colombiana]